MSRFAWPVPEAALGVGPWVEAGSPIETCVRGIHACRTTDLAWWLSGQLWEIELGGQLIVDDYTIVASRGRLIRRVPGWPEVGAELAEWAVWRSRDRAVALLASSGSPDAARLAACRTIDGLVEVTAGLDQNLHTPEGVAVALAADNVTDLPNPVSACHTSARAAGHAASLDGSRVAYHEGFAAERRAQGAWLAGRLGLT